MTKKVGEILNIKYNDPIFTEEQLCKIIEKSDVNSLDESFDNALYNLVLNYDENSNIILTEKLLLSLISKSSIKTSSSSVNISTKVVLMAFLWLFSKIIFPIENK